MNAAFLAIFTLFSAISFSAILFGADPYSASDKLVVLFFLTLFFSLAGLFSLAGMLVGKVARKSSEFAVSLRRGFLLATLVTSLVLIEKFFVLNIGNAAAIFMAIIAIEMIAVYKR